MDGTLLREENGAIWVVFGGARFHVPDMATLNRLYGGKPVSQLWDGGPARCCARCSAAPGSTFPIWLR